MRTQIQEWISRAKTWLWSAFWVALVYFVDVLLQSLSVANLPTVTTDLWGLLPAAMVINTAVPVGLLLNQISKYLHNMRAGKIL
jgi:hypothetical protein